MLRIFHPGICPGPWRIMISDTTIGTKEERKAEQYYYHDSICTLIRSSRFGETESTVNENGGNNIFCPTTGIFPLRSSTRPASESASPSASSKLVLSRFITRHTSMSIVRPSNMYSV